MSAIPKGKSRTAIRPTRTEPVGVAELAALASAELPDSIARREQVQVTGVTLHAQEVRHGDLFAALPGARVHGADFSASALAAGATAVLTDRAGANRPALRDSGIPLLVCDNPRAVVGTMADRIYGQPSRRLAVLGVTGTSGKTTTTYLIDSVLRAAGLTTGLIGTVGTKIAGQQFATTHTTPEAPDLQALLAFMVEQGVTHVSMEVSSHALALGRVAGVRFAVGAFTNLSQDHLDFHSDMEDYFAAKATLFDGRAAAEVVCVDTEWGHRLVKPGVVTVSTVGDAHWTATDIRSERDGSQSFTALGPAGAHIPLMLRLPGSFNVANALVALAVAQQIGISEEAIANGLADVRVPGRMEPVDIGQDFTAVVDYAHKPTAVKSALAAVRAQLARAERSGRVITVLGCGGDRDTGKRPLMGEYAARLSELLVITDDNPRTEDPSSIREEMLCGALNVPTAERAEIIEIGDRQEAIRYAVAAALPGDVVVVAGKGHETGQEIGEVVRPFSDREELEAAIRQREARAIREAQ